MSDLIVVQEEPVILIVTETAPTVVTIIESLPQTVEVVSVGPQGPAGQVIIRVHAIVSASTITPNADADDLVDITALAANTTILASSGTPANGQRLLFRIKDSGSVRTLTWNAQYVSGGVPLPTATTAGKIGHYGFFYNSATSKWVLVAGLVEP